MWDKSDILWLIVGKYFPLSKGNFKQNKTLKNLDHGIWEFIRWPSANQDTTNFLEVEQDTIYYIILCAFLSFAGRLSTTVADPAFVWEDGPMAYKIFKAHSAKKIFSIPSRGAWGHAPQKIFKIKCLRLAKMHCWQLRGVKFQVKFLLFVSIIALSIIIGIFPAKKDFFRELWGVASHPVHSP